MIGALICLAGAVLMAPVSRSRRRFVGMFVSSGDRRKLRRGSMFRWGFGVATVVALAVGIGPLVAAVLVGGTVGIRVRRASRDRRRGAECAHLLDALEAVIGELRVGAHPSAAAEVAAREARGEAARAFAVSAARSRLGGSGADGLRHPDSIVDAELARIADAWQVAEDHGLALAELLSAARTDLLGRIRFRTRTTAALAGARATAAVLACLPLLGIGLGQLMGAAPLQVLLSPGAGSVLLPLGAALACIGLLWTDAITRKVLL
ncbi:type II secretion system F family protein [Nocardia sp. CA-107356]|uniref:type II secretion system F family protein n=1 Tax=Nocardia sp. CA-107356 TaxID=3239972 RepID=UPI003D8B0BD5